MHLIDHPTAAPGGLFTEGDPVSGTPATIVTGDWLNAVQLELANAIQGAGLTLNKANNAQLLAAIQALIAATGPAWRTGDVILTFRPTAEAGWIVANDGTIGNAGSGATTRAHADTEALFEMLWNSVGDAYAPVSGGRGASAAADFAAGKTIQLTRMLGRAIAVAGSGSGLTARSLGQYLGTEAHQLTANEMPAHNHTGSTDSQGSHSHSGVTDSQGNHSHYTQVNSSTNSNTSLAGAASHGHNAAYGATLLYTGNTNAANANGPLSSTSGAHAHNLSINAAGAHSHALSINNAGGGQAHNNMQPTVFLHAHINL